MKKHLHQILAVFPIALLFALGLLSFALYSASSPWTVSAINYSWKYVFFAAAGVGLAVLAGLPVFKPNPRKKALWGSLVIGGTFLFAVVLNLAPFQAFARDVLGGDLISLIGRNVDGGRFAILLLLAGLLLLADGLNRDRKRSYPILCAAGLFCAFVLTVANEFSGGLAAVLLVSFLLFAPRERFAGNKAVKLICNAVALILSALVVWLKNDWFISVAQMIYAKHGAVPLLGASGSPGALSPDNTAGQLLASFGWLGLAAAVLLSFYIIIKMFRAAGRNETVSGMLIWKLSAAYFAINTVLKLFFFIFSLPVSSGSHFSFAGFGPALTVDYFLMGCYLTHTLRAICKNVAV